MSDAPAVRRMRLPLLRGSLAALTSCTIGTAGPLGLDLLAVVLLPLCSRAASPPALVAVTLGCLLSAALAPLAVAGLRLWWVGGPAAALAVHGVLPTAWPLLTEPQSGLCF